MRTKKNPNIDYYDAFKGKSTPSWIYFNWESLYVPQYRWQPRLAISLPLMRSPPHVTQKQCYDKIPSSYKNAILFVYPITREIYPDAQVQKCSDWIKNLSQFDMEDENTWFTITHTPEHRKRPALFGPKHLTTVFRRVLVGAGDARIYTRAQLLEFYDKVLISAASRKASLKFSREFIFPNTAIHEPEQYSYYAPRTDFYVDNMISLNYFKNQFMDIFGSIVYVMELCGIYFSCFLFMKLIVDLIVMALRHMKLHRITGASLGFGKTLLSASYNLFLLSILTSVFNPKVPLLQALEPEPTPAKLEDETRDRRDGNRKT